MNTEHFPELEIEELDLLYEQALLAERDAREFRLCIEDERFRRQYNEKVLRKDGNGG